MGALQGREEKARERWRDPVMAAVMHGSTGPGSQGPRQQENSCVGACGVQYKTILSLKKM